MGERERTSGLWAALGPGVLFTGAAVGVSHLVQSTRAGAVYGFSLVLVVLAANVLKYPAFRFGPQYAVATGTSLLEGYRRQGRWALVLYAFVTVGTMFVVEAAVTVVTAGLVKFLFGVEASVVVVSAALLVLCGGLVAAGRYRWLDRVSKVVVSALAVSTVVAFVSAVPTIDWSGVRLWPAWGSFEARDVMFLAALVGWMPSAIDVAVWQSLWTLARERDTGHRPTRRESLVDFHAGYVGTAVLAFFFLGLGAAVMHGRGVEPAAGPGAFAAQVVTLYTETLGAWSRPVIGGCALLTMFSTTLTVVDGFPRALSVMVRRFGAPEEPRTAGASPAPPLGERRVYWGSLIVIGVGSIAIVWFVLGGEGGLRRFEPMIDVATTLSFLTAPILAWLNHRAVLGPEVPDALKPAPWLVVASWAGIVALSLFAAYYLYLITG